MNGVTFLKTRPEKKGLKSRPKDYFVHKPVSMSYTLTTKIRKRKKNELKKKKSNEKKQFQIFTSLLKCEVLPDSVLSRWLLVGFFRVASVRWYCVYLLVFFSRLSKNDMKDISHRKRRENTTVWPPSSICDLMRFHVERWYIYFVVILVGFFGTGARCLCVFLHWVVFFRKFGVPSIWYKTRRVSISKDWISQNRQRSRRNVFGVILCSVIVIAAFILTSLVEI